ncbi:hypothetical protein THRCLA_11155 [Thraustotheca clavata]|uniref:PTM/DIR17-like Tudor domain-containing protein n=1 Tax=Thraustotheca clavata TaxID=74557 RepID=A0A1V9Y8L5_9STRA|nr:hypothetical protein THRCLA_11155 [Thraustotheca clavata]
MDSNNPEEKSPEKSSLRSEEKVPQPESNLVGRKVRKHFEGFGWYQGTIMRHWKSEEYGDQFHVVYTDGDAEDLSRETLMKYLLPVTPQLSAKEVTPSKQDPPRAPTPPERPRAPTPSQSLHGRSRSSDSNEGPAKFARLDQTQYSPHPSSEKSFQYNNDSPAPQADRQLQRKSSLSGIAFHGEQNAWHNGSQFVQRPNTTSSNEEEDRFQRFQGPQALPSVAQRTSFLSPQPPPAYYPEQGPYSHTYIKSELPRLSSSSSITSQQQQREESYPPALSKPKLMLPLSQDQSPLGRLNYHFLKAIKDTTQHYKFGEAFTCVLRDDPGHTNGMDITRLMQYCHQRRYPRINLFLNDVVKMRNTVSSTYPQDFAFRQQAGEYIDVLTRCIQDLAPVLRQIEAIIIAEEEKPNKFY